MITILGNLRFGYNCTLKWLNCTHVPLPSHILMQLHSSHKWIYRALYRRYGHTVLLWLTINWASNAWMACMGLINLLSDNIVSSSESDNIVSSSIAFRYCFILLWSADMPVKTIVVHSWFFNEHARMATGATKHICYNGAWICYEIDSRRN
jgi:hypothetical protein